MGLPLPYERKPPQKQLAILQNGHCWHEDGRETACTSWRQVKGLIEDETIVLCPQIAAQAWFHEALSDGASPSLSEKRGLTGLRIAFQNDRRRSGWVSEAELWRTGLHSSMVSNLHYCRLALENLSCGTYPTPSALGLASMSRWFDLSQPRLFRPPAGCERVIRAGLVGGRVDTIQAGREFQVLYEADINNAYAWASQRLPAGECYAVSRLGNGTGRAYFASCSVRGPGNPRTGLCPLPSRRADSRIEYPASGQWEGWYWGEEIEAARQAGYEVIPAYGWEWSDWSAGLAQWANRIHRLRLDCLLRGNAETLPNAATLEEARRVSEIIKLATVAGIGRLGGHESVDELTDDETARPYIDAGSGLLDPFGSPWPWFLKAKPVRRPELLPHIASYINMRVRLATWRRACEEGDALVATNYDAVYTLRKPNEAQSSELGGWKWAALHPGDSGLSVPYPRGLYSLEKTTLPGMPYAARAA